MMQLESQKQRTGKEEILEVIIAKDFPKLIKNIQS